MEIGGYFELELRKGEHFHPTAVKLNSGRCALEYILQVKEYRRVYLPYFTCATILEPIDRLGIEYEFYHINEQMKPLFNYSNIKQNETFIYINYFGLHDHVISELVNICPNLIIDNSQSFFSKPIDGIDTLYSARKFFGVPDGAYLYFDGPGLIEDLPMSISTDRFEHLLMRIESGPEFGYLAFKESSSSFTGEPIKRMSLLTQRLLENIDYEFVSDRRKSNFGILHSQLAERNLLELSSWVDSVPMVYPFLTNKPDLKSRLIEQGIFVATYWPNVLLCCDSSSLEYNLANSILHLPVDQRYTNVDMQYIVDFIENET